jgi:hypothetical protein
MGVKDLGGRNVILAATSEFKKDARHLPIESAVGSGFRNLPRIRNELWHLTRGGIFIEARN